jgi:hypothetical protein
MRTAIVTLLIILLGGANSAAQSLDEIETTLVGHLQKLELVSNYGGSGDYAAQADLNQKLRDALMKFGARSDVLDYPFPKLDEMMSITTSKDRRLRAYSWDTESGGTMHDYMTVYQFQKRNGDVGVWALPYSDDISEYGAGSFVHQIFQTETPKETLYLVVSTFIGSTSLSGQSLTVFRIENDNLNTEAKLIRTTSGLKSSVSFSYDFFSVVDRPERPIRLFEYDEAKKEFRFPIVIEDEKTPQGRVTDKFITYRFNGKYFVKKN